MGCAASTTGSKDQLREASEPLGRAALACNGVQCANGIDGIVGVVGNEESASC
jgi:hypothetical protein